MTGREFHVFDGGGEHLGSFPTFTAAHDWAHLQAALGGVVTPVEVEDRGRRVTRLVSREGCHILPWRVPGREETAAEACQAAGPADPAASMQTGLEGSPDAYSPGRQPPKPRPPLDAEIVRGGRRDR